VKTIYKICEKAVWHEAETARRFLGSPADIRDGFIHFSTVAQLPGTLEKHYAGMRDLLLVAVDAGALGEELKWETSRGGDLFPHLYGPLPLAAVRWTRPLADEIGSRRPVPELES
jgi:uncharacterized protein (DUF952 family)